MMSRPVTSPRWALAFLGLLGVACVSVPQQTPNMERAGVKELTATQLREMVLEYAADFGQAVERTADSIRTVVHEPELRYLALLLKSTAVHQMRQAALISDPLLALVDVWLYAVQLRMFVESPPPGYGKFDEGHRAMALEVLERKEQRAVQLAISAVGAERVGQFTGRLHKFAEEHPIDPLTLGRTSILAADSAVLRPVGGGIGGTMAATYWSMRDVADRVDGISAGLGKELRWNIELLAHDLTAMPVVDSTLTSVRASLDRLAALADTLPMLVTGERAAVLAALHTELADLTSAIESMRVATLETVSGERVAVLEALTRERVAMLEAVTTQRIATLAAVDSILQGTMDRSERLVDHIIWRLAQLLAVCLIVLLIAAVIVLRVWRPSRS
jgi:hypothetical protein